MSEQHQALGNYFFTRKTKVKEPMLNYDTAKTYFSYAIQDDFEKLYTIFSTQTNSKNFKLFMYFVEVNGANWCQEFRQISNNKLNDWSKILGEAKHIWYSNEIRVKLGKNNIRVLAKITDGSNFDIDAYTTSACSSTNEYCMRIKTTDDLKQIVELKFANWIEITECYPDLDLSMYPPDVIENKITKYLAIRENCRRWTFEEFRTDFQFFLKNREKRYKNRYDSSQNIYSKSEASYSYYT